MEEACDKYFVEIEHNAIKVINYGIQTYYSMWLKPKHKVLNINLRYGPKLQLARVIKNPHASLRKG